MPKKSTKSTKGPKISFKKDALGFPIQPKTYPFHNSPFQEIISRTKSKKATELARKGYY
jgi:hypothetical protein